jgi:DNA-binding CsgD family transcriptional regulator
MKPTTQATDAHAAVLHRERGQDSTPPAGRRQMTYDNMVAKLARCTESGDVTAGLRTLTEYVGAAGFLLARHDLNSGDSLEGIISSDWPFDLVRHRGAELVANLTKATEHDKCLSILHPAFAFLAEEAILPAGASRQYCSIMFNAGRNHYCLMFLCPLDVILSQHRLRETGLLCSYFASLLFNKGVRVSREMDLTERELECLYWIAEGKTSDEIAVIIGISRNTINNYITSIMRKTSTRTRSEAIAFAVRNHLV